MSTEQLQFKIPVIAGIRIIRRHHSKSGTAEIYVEATHPCHGKSPRRFYAGTLQTCTQQRIDKAYLKATEIRAKWRIPLDKSSAAV